MGRLVWSNKSFLPWFVSTSMYVSCSFIKYNIFDFLFQLVTVDNLQRHLTPAASNKLFSNCHLSCFRFKHKKESRKKSRYSSFSNLTPRA